MEKHAEWTYYLGIKKTDNSITTFHTLCPFSPYIQKVYRAIFGPYIDKEDAINNTINVYN